MAFSAESNIAEIRCLFKLVLLAINLVSKCHCAFIIDYMDIPFRELLLILIVVWCKL